MAPLTRNTNTLTAVLLVTLLALGSGTPARKSKKVGGGGGGLLTCPGFPGYCSEAYPGDTCSVVCARGRNNVPECQEDGTWTDVPRCIEHEPGQEQQVSRHCPGVPGYCSLDLPGGLCTFQCPLGDPIRSSCTTDGTWEPYPVCQGDPRETQDGCDPCPGPLGAERNRTLESGSGGFGGQARNSGGQNRNVGGNNRNGGGNRRNGVGNNRNGGGNNRNGGGQNRNGGGQNRNGGGQNRNGGGGQSRNGGGGSRNGGGQNRGGQNNRISSTGPRKQEQPRSIGGGGSKSSAKGGSCPGDELQACIDVCPGFTARVFGACVAGCAKRCPSKK